MNNGKICISVCAETADELIEQIKRAEELADIIEIRFDCLVEREFDSAFQKLNNFEYKKTFLATLRPKSSLAMFACPFGENVSLEIKEKAKKEQTFRNNGWHKISELKNVSHIDFETDIQTEFFTTEFKFDENSVYFFSEEVDRKLKSKQIIISEHFFDNVPENVAQQYEAMKSEIEDGIKSDVIKIAVQTDDITDTIPIWKLLEKAKLDDQQIIPIAMGESGKWTRILGLAHGAFMTYAALDSGKETAPGQVSAKDLTEVYRVKELDENTEVYGILGNNTSVSMSPYIHNAAFKFHNLNSVFVPLQVNDLDEFIKRMVKPETREIDLNFKGFSVTIPHKQSIIKHLDFIDESAQKIGAVNTVKIVDGKLHGYNTDANGFIEPLKNTYGDLENVKVAIVGAGGAARACIYALKTQGAIVTIFARDLEKAKTLAEDFEVDLRELPKTKDQRPKTDFKEFEILVNTTPLGMKGKFDGASAAIAEQLEGLNLVYDLIYIPFQTPLMTEADKANVPKIGGLAMLIAQAMEQQKNWTGLDAPMKEMSRAALQKLK